MKIKIGDRVRFLNDSGEGMVIKLLPDNLVEVRTPDGWDIPYPIQELIVIPSEEGEEVYRPEPFENKNDSKNYERKEQEEKNEGGSSTDVLLLFAQDREEGNFAGIRSYLVNDTMQDLDFIYYRITQDNISIEEKDILEPGTKLFLDELKLEDLSSLRGWHIQALLSGSGQDFVPPVINQFISFQPAKFASAGAYSENDFLHEPAILIPLVPDEAVKDEPDAESLDISNILSEKESENVHLNAPKIFRQARQDIPPREVDLHINQLIDRVIGLSNREIINIQMETFHRELNLAISGNERSIVFIHGIGNGTLKKELHKSIERDYPICEYEDASFKEYGFGATLIRIRQNK